MSGLEIVVHGAESIERRLEAHEARIKRSHRKATRAAAKQFQRSLRRILPRKTGRLRRHVGLYPFGESGTKVKITGRVAHLALGEVKEHVIQPRAIAAGDGKRALSYSGASHAFARALIPTHRGDPTIIPRARAEGSGPAHLAAMEVLAHG